jgi:hypothetical protein
MHRLALLLLPLAAIPACDRLETREAKFATYEQLATSGEPGNWVPAFLPQSATDIRVRYKIDTGDALVSFRLPSADSLELGGQCEDAESRAVSFPAPRLLGTRWWPDDLTSSSSATDSAYLLFRCERDSFMAIDRSDNAGFYWRLGPASWASG